MPCARCGDDNAPNVGSHSLYDPEKGGSYRPTFCRECWREGPLVYCPGCDEFRIADPEWNPGRSGGRVVPCRDCSIDDEEPTLACHICGEPSELTSMLINPHNRVYCSECAAPRRMIMCRASYCGIDWHEEDSVFTANGRRCPGCEVNMPDGVAHIISHPAEWDIEEGCRCRLCSALQDIPFPGEGQHVDCAHHGGVTPIEGTRELEGDYYCHMCIESSGRNCTTCGERLMLNMLTAVADAPGMHCSGCIEQEFPDYWFCDVQCNVWFPEDRECDCDGVYGYQYRPDEFEFFTVEDRGFNPDRHPYIGFELEIEALSTGTSRAEAAAMIRDHEWCYPVHDGSLAGRRDDGTGGQNGVEMVSHPMSFRWFNRHFGTIHDTLKLYRERGYRSWESGRCGMHVHISRRPMSEAHQLRFINFLYGSINLCLAVGQRTYASENLRQFASFTSEDRSRLIQKIKQNTNPGVRDHYCALNAQYSETFEARWFRGTLNPNSFRKNVEFIHSAFEFTRQFGMRSSNEVNYMDWLFTPPRLGDYASLVDFLKDNYITRSRTR